MGEGDGMGQVKEEFKDEVPVKSEPGSDNENGPVDDEEKMDQLEILRRCRSVKQGLEALRQEQSSILHSLVATLSAIRREKDPDTRWRLFTHKNPFLHQKNPFLHQKNPFLHQKNSFLQQKNPFLHQKNPFLHQKNPFFYHSFLFLVSLKKRQRSFGGY